MEQKRYKTKTVQEERLQLNMKHLQGYQMKSVI